MSAQRLKKLYEISKEKIKKNENYEEVLQFAIDTSSGDTNYMVGLRNGLRCALSIYTGDDDPHYEECVEEKKGKWEKDYEEILYHCSNCGARWSYAQNMRYCPSCGARMEKRKYYF